MDASFLSKAILEASDLEKFTIPHFKLYVILIEFVILIQYYFQVMSLYQQEVFLVSLDEGSAA